MALESLGAVCPGCFHNFEVRRDSVTALFISNEDENPVDVSVQAVQG